MRWHALPLCLLALGLFGCQQGPPPVAELPPPEVTVSKPIEREIVDYDEFTGHTDAVESVEIRARVFGYLDKIYFNDGAEVKKGDMLFLIDPRPYDAELDRATADVAKWKAQQALADVEFRRYEQLIKSRSASKEDLDKASAELKQAEAGLLSSQAAEQQAKLNVAFTKITAPISGRISRQYVSVGNLVNGGAGGSTLLTTIVSMDPMYVYFDVDEPTYLHYRKLAAQTRETDDARSLKEAKIPVFVALAGEDDFSHRGVLDFSDNRVDPSTGTIRVRAVFQNADRVLTPGLFCRVRIPSTDPQMSLLVTERAIGSDQGRRYVLVVTGKDVAEYRPIKIGTQHDDLIVVAEGLTADDRVIVNGIQRVRPGMTVKPQTVPMPTMAKELPSPKPDDKVPKQPAAKSTKASTKESLDEPAKKASAKPVGTPTPKPSESAPEKAVEKPAAKPVDAAAPKADAEPPEKPAEKTTNDAADKTSSEEK